MRKKGKGGRTKEPHQATWGTSREPLSTPRRSCGTRLLSAERRLLANGPLLKGSQTWPCLSPGNAPDLPPTPIPTILGPCVPVPRVPSGLSPNRVCRKCHTRELKCRGWGGGTRTPPSWSLSGPGHRQGEQGRLETLAGLRLGRGGRRQMTVARVLPVTASGGWGRSPVSSV